MTDLPSSYLNSWEYVQELQDVLSTRVNGKIHSLDEAWVAQYDVSAKERSYDENVLANPLEYFRYCIDEGMIPPPEILIAVKSCFDAYYLAEGKLELEDVFFGSRTKRIGNNAALFKNDVLYEDFHLFLDVEYEISTIRDLKLLEKLTRNYLDSKDMYEVEVKSFLTGCRRWRERTGRYMELAFNQGDT